MFKNRVQIGRLSGVDGLVDNAGNYIFIYSSEITVDESQTIIQ